MVAIAERASELHFGEAEAVAQAIGGAREALEFFAAHVEAKSFRLPRPRGFYRGAEVWQRRDLAGDTRGRRKD